MCTVVTKTHARTYKPNTSTTVVMFNIFSTLIALPPLDNSYAHMHE